MPVPVYPWPSGRALACLVRRAQGNDPRALNALLVAVRPPIVADYARRLPSDLAEDCAQVALIRLVGALPRIDPERADRYIARLVHNALRTALRRHALQARRSVPLDVAEPLIGDEFDEEDAFERERVEALRRAVASGLPSPLRELVVDLLRGYSTAEIAVRQHVSPVTVRTRLHRARTLLHDALLEAAPRLDARRPRYERPLLRSCESHPAEKRAPVRE